MLDSLTSLALKTMRIVRHATACSINSLITRLTTLAPLMIGTSNDWANGLDAHVSEYEREDAAEHQAPHNTPDIRCKNIHPPSKLPKLETLLVSESNFHCLAKISQLMQGVLW